jgi:DNA-binding CsgD family transcriptional regulator
MATIACDSYPSSPERTIERSGLKEAERRVLRLLAEGHTAKSIATELGTSIAAVNERLREARRKTGIGSSRELARLLKTQENRDEQMGMAGLAAPAANLPSGAEVRRPQTGVLMMIAFFLAVTAGTAVSLYQPSDHTHLHAKLRVERPDRSWAEPTEKTIRARLMQISPIGRGGNVLRVTCGVTLCEVAGTLAGEGRASNRQDPTLRLDRAVADLQDKSLDRDLARLGLKNESSSFVSSESKSGGLTFFLYYSRAD